MLTRAGSAFIALLLAASCSTAPSVHTGSSSQNSLGMTFRRIPGSNAEMCIHETRECDYLAFRGKASSRSTVAATNVNWIKAKAFCAWLSAKENRRYRLPTDYEWSQAAGIGAQENAAASPESKRRNIPGVYPWGTQWPPTSSAGNYYGSEAVDLIHEVPIPGFRDGQEHVCAVMKFTPNSNGFYDMGGNVWEWCEDEYRPGTNWRVLRGAAWNCSQPEVLLTSHRTFDPPNYRSNTVGFRVVRE